MTGPARSALWRENPAVTQHRSSRVAVFSAGSWGTAVASILGDASTSVVLHARRDEVADVINTQHRNVDYFPGVDCRPRSPRRPTRPLPWKARASWCCPSLRRLCGPTSPCERRTSQDTVIVLLTKGYRAEKPSAGQSDRH
ncbi:MULTISPECIES: hypothetical protein [unclassified Streptomyces]|uniref:hypothetical protein n=1 Tax=unclassified Streptomyces TaxID=2593676 RepID=UPI00214C18F1|nr:MULTISPECIES: hypothetical protein [unclassified Streptomyces]